VISNFNTGESQHIFISFIGQFHSILIWGANIYFLSFATSLCLFWLKLFFQHKKKSFSLFAENRIAQVEKALFLPNS